MKIQILHRNLAALLAIGAATASGANLVLNGDFELGNTGFTSDYTFETTTIMDPAEYTVGINPANHHNVGESYGDHSTGSGSMAIFNGSEDAGDIAWQSSTITVVPGTDYAFGAWASNWTVGAGQGSELSFQILDSDGTWVTLGTIGFDGSTAGNWLSTSGVWTSGIATSTALRVMNSQTSFNGNDFALDDITFTSLAVPEASAMTLLSVAGSAGLIRRRRRR